MVVKKEPGRGRVNHERAGGDVSRAEMRAGETLGSDFEEGQDLESMSLFRVIDRAIVTELVAEEVVRGSLQFAPIIDVGSRAGSSPSFPYNSLTPCPT